MMAEHSTSTGKESVNSSKRPRCGLWSKGPLTLALEGLAKEDLILAEFALGGQCDRDFHKLVLVGTLEKAIILISRLEPKLWGEELTSWEATEYSCFELA